MQQTSATLMNMIQSSAPRQLCSSNVRFIRDDLLEFPAAHVKKHQPDYVIMGAGAHFHSPTEYETVMTEVYRVIGEIRRNHTEDLATSVRLGTNETFKVPKFIWKTMNMPHANCDAYANATEVIPEMPADDPFDWRFFRGYDTLMMNMSISHNITVIDMSPLYYRADAHPGKQALARVRNPVVDCLHFCLPGPVDMFSNLALQMLLEDQYENP